MFDSTTTIEFKRNYQLNKQILQQDLEKLYQVIEETLKKTKNIYIFGCSIYKIDAKYIVPTKINMKDGLMEKIMEERND